MRSIADVERETLVPRATLRMWERRYGFPAPSRDERGERSYPGDQVQLLREVRSLLDQGHRPAKLLARGAAEVRRLVSAAALPARAQARPRDDAQLLRILREHDAGALLAQLESRLRAGGLARFAGEDMPAMNALVGHAWSTGEIEVHEEHHYSDCVHQVVRNAIRQLEGRIRPEAPQVLLTTFPNEHHGLGLLMSHAMFALQGCPTVSLGVRLPLAQIVAGARAYRADLVGLSFTPAVNPAHVARGLEELRGMLATSVRIWAGGSNPALSRREIPGVRFVGDVLAIPHLLAEDFALPPVDSPG
jgi:DNA-binding transcriptional MerR regulator